MNNLNELYRVANQLADQGLTPSVALIKSKLTKSLSLPQIIEGLKTWQHTPGAQKEELKHTERALQTNNTDLSEVEIAIKNAIKPLKTEIAELRELIATLISQK